MDPAKKQIARLLHQFEEVCGLLDGLLVVAASRVPVLLLGPRGTGIDLLARAVHAASSRGSRPFVILRCGYASSSQLATELTRHATAPAGDSPENILAQANGGTLYVDQIQNTSIALQAELLRVLTEGAYVDPIEGTTHRSHLRIIASAWTDLEARTKDGRFRKDLYDRLHVTPLHLRKGFSDEAHFLQGIDALRGKTSADPHLLEQLRQQFESLTLSEPVRRLQQELRACDVENSRDALLQVLRRMGTQHTHAIAKQNLQLANEAVERCVETHEVFAGRLYETLMEDLQRSLIARALVQSNGTLARAAEILGMKLDFLESLLDRLKLHL